MGRRPMKKIALEQDVYRARDRYCYLQNRHGEMVAFTKRMTHKRERQQGKREARLSSNS